MLRKTEKTMMLFLLIIFLYINPFLFFSLPMLEVKKSYIELGSLPQFTKKKFEIVIKNSGDLLLEVKNIVTFCFCTVVDTKSFNLLPGKEQKVKAVLDSSNFLGDITRLMVIVSNDNKVRYQVRVHANIFQQYFTEPLLEGYKIHLDNIVSKYGLKKEIVIYHYKNEKVFIEKIMGNESLFDFNWDKPIKSNARNETHFFINVKPNLKMGFISNEEIKIIFKNQSFFIFTLAGRVNEFDLHTEPGFIRFNEVKEKNIKKKNLVLRTYTGKKFAIKKIISTNPSLKITYHKLSDSSYGIDVELLSEKQKGMIFKIQIISDYYGEERATYFNVLI